jgi:hypothetical protein
MHHGMDSFERVCTCHRIPDVAEDGAGTRIGQGRETVCESSAQVIQYGDLMARPKSDFGCVGSDEAPSPRNQQAHDLSSIRHAIDLCG